MCVVAVLELENAAAGGVSYPRGLAFVWSSNVDRGGAILSRLVLLFIAYQYRLLL